MDAIHDADAVEGSRRDGRYAGACACADTHASTDADTHAGTDADANADPNAHADADADANAFIRVL